MKMSLLVNLKIRNSVVQCSGMPAFRRREISNVKSLAELQGMKVFLKVSLFTPATFSHFFHSFPNNFFNFTSPIVWLRNNFLYW